MPLTRAPMQFHRDYDPEAVLRPEYDTELTAAADANGMDYENEMDLHADLDGDIDADINADIDGNLDGDLDVNLRTIADLKAEMDINTVLTVDEDGVAKVEDEPVDDIPMFEMENELEDEPLDDVDIFETATWTMPMRPSTPTTPTTETPSTPTTETPPGTPPGVASPIANKEKKIAEKGPFWCTHIGCDRTVNGGREPFKQKVNMETHVKSVHEKKTIMCPICKKNISYNNFSAHMKKTHAASEKKGKGKHCTICNRDMRGDMARHCRRKEHRRNMRNMGE